MFDNGCRGQNADDSIVAGIGRVFDPDFGVGELLKLLYDGAGFSNEATDAGRVAEQAEENMTWGDEERRLWRFEAFEGGGGRCWKVGTIAIGLVHSGGNSVDRVLYWRKEDGTFHYAFPLRIPTTSLHSLSFSSHIRTYIYISS